MEERGWFEKSGPYRLIYLRQLGELPPPPMKGLAHPSQFVALQRADPAPHLGSTVVLALVEGSGQVSPEDSARES